MLINKNQQPIFKNEPKNQIIHLQKITSFGYFILRLFIFSISVFCRFYVFSSPVSPGVPSSISISCSVSHLAHSNNGIAFKCLCNSRFSGFFFLILFFSSSIFTQPLRFYAFFLLRMNVTQKESIEDRISEKYHRLAQHYGYIFVSSLILMHRPLS